MKKACVLLADGFEEVEALTVVDLLRRAEIDVTIAAVSDKLLVTGAGQISVQADKFLRDVDLDGADLLVLPGGMPGTTNLEKCPSVQEAIRSFDKKKKYIGAICAAPAILLGKAGYLKGRKATCYPGMEEYLVGAEAVKEPVVVADHFITSRGVGVAIPFACQLIELLISKEKASEIAASVVSSWK